MGNYRKFTQIIQPDAQPSGTAAQTCRFRLPRQSRRLSHLALRVRQTTGASLPTNTDGDGLAAVVREVRLNISDIRGDRSVVKASGPALLSYSENNEINRDRKSQVGYAGTGFPASTAVDIRIPIWCAHPKITEPLRHNLGIPWSSNFLGNDPVLEVDLAAVVAGASNVYVTNGTTWPSNALELLAVYHEVPESVPYLPWQLESSLWKPNQVSKVPYIWSQVGVLMQSLWQTYTDDNLQARVTPLSSGGTVKLEYGTNQYGDLSQEWTEYLNDQTRLTYPDSVSAVIASSFLFERNIGGEMFFDFMSDLPGTDLFAAAAAFNLDQSALKGDTMRLVFNDYASTANPSRVTNFRLLPSSAAEIAQLLVR